ncbi:MAG: radical SAM family heme chaperone HemW, partial [bacterium]
LRVLVVIAQFKKLNRKGREGALRAEQTSHISLVPRHVYLHVPFCARRCSYCDFSIAVRRDVPVDEYLCALEAELHTRFAHRQPTEVDTIYLGGGTPSRLGGEGVARALDLVRRQFHPAADAEITIEANPDDVTPETATRWREAGVNRLSLGGQSFDDAVLVWMHRTHDAATTATAVVTARAAGIDNLSLDLIFALPENLHRDFTRDVDQLLALRPDHVSLYGLTVEPMTPLGRWVSRGLTFEQPDEGYESDFLEADRRLAAEGFEHYEVSNYGRPGRRARHNSAYWSGVPYVGLGPSAHGFDGQVRRWNARHYADWRDQATSGADPLEGSEVLTAENRVAEAVYLGMRCDAGLPLAPGDRAVVDRWVDAGWATIGPEDRLRCTAQGWLRLDALAAALTHHRSR